MKYQSSKLRKLAASGAAGLVLAQSLQAATVLTGVTAGEIDEADGDPIGSRPNRRVPVNHGSYAPDTPNIGLTWEPRGARGWETYANWPNGDGTGQPGRVYQLDGPSSGAPYTGEHSFRITFTPNLASIAVVLNSLTLNDYAGPSNPALQNTTLDWSVTGNGDRILGSGAGIVVANGTTQELPFNLQGFGGEAITLILTPTGGAGSYFAIDNLSFDQVVIPEPSGAILATAGLGALALRRRRK